MRDVEQFTERIRADLTWRTFLTDGRQIGSEIIVTRAPGRLDVMGGVGDYSGVLVAETTLAEAALVALAPRQDRQLRLWSVGIEDDGLDAQVTLSLDDFFDKTNLLDYPAVSRRLRGDSRTAWSAYVAGCFYTILAERGDAVLTQGANILLHSDVPLGAGVSSSAAIEVATMQAINAAYGLGLNGIEVACLAQRTENRVVGAPCGIMDQMTSALGVQDSLFLLLCRPHEVQGTQRLPSGVRLFGINSAVKHSVGGSAYTRARVAAFMGRKLLGVDYLAHISPMQYLADYIDRLPDEIRGSGFLAQYGETGDTVTQISPEETYPVRAAAEHAIYENNRVQRFVELLSDPNLGQQGSEIDRGGLAEAGSLMYAAHDGYNRIGLGSLETNLLVDMSHAIGRTVNGGIYGAKITGGGSGGTVVFLTYGEDGEAAVRGVAANYASRTNLTPQVFAGSSPGAVEFGHRSLSLQE